MIGNAGINEAGLSEVIHAFYGKVRDDAELGPVSNDAIPDWPHHLGKMVEFWSPVTLTSGISESLQLGLSFKLDPHPSGRVAA